MTEKEGKPTLTIPVPNTPPGTLFEATMLPSLNVGQLAYILNKEQKLINGKSIDESALIKAIKDNNLPNFEFQKEETPNFQGKYVGGEKSDAADLLTEFYVSGHGLTCK